MKALIRNTPNQVTVWGEDELDRGWSTIIPKTVAPDGTFTLKFTEDSFNQLIGKINNQFRGAPPSELQVKRTRYSFLTGYGMRTPEESDEMYQLQAELELKGFKPEWDIVPSPAPHTPTL